MSAPKRPSDDQDPDYVSPGPTNAKQQKLYEETARANTANKIVAIVEREFGKDIDAKEKEVLEIQSRLHKALKTLHLLRYVVITDFYNRKQCQAPQSQSAEAKQTQIHPAIKRLIGKTPRRQRGLGLQDPGPSTSGEFENDEVRVKTEPDEIDVRLGQSSEEEKPASPEPPKKIPRHVPPRSNIPNVASPSRGVRHKVRKRIVVGNISKWIPRDWREDGASHKWMMYVRGSKDEPDITEFVSKVRFFLHPSYQPNDIVQVTSPPFHLSRRGWGEFPLRVQLHFKNALNKPMDIIHHLKLDRTYTGLQTLGSETVVDIWIHTTTPPSFRKNLDSEIIGASQDTEDIDLSIVKKEKESLEGSEMLVSPSNDLKNLVKAEPAERRDSVEESLHVFNDNCIKIEHNYVSNTCEGEESTQVVHELENNVTIRHSPPVKNELPTKNSQEAGSSNAEAKTSEKTEQRIEIQEENVATSNGRDNCENIESNKINSVKNVQNGDSASPVPIKLVKCNDRFFFMTDVGKLSNNQVDFVKIANSDIVKNILAKRIQPGKVSITVQKPAQSNSDGLELSNGQNGAKLEFITKLSQSNSQQLEMQKLATSLRSIPSKSEPLKITIPPHFEPTRKKQILVLKNNQIISMNAGNSRQLAPRSILYEKNQDAATDNKNRVFLSAAGAKPTEGTSLLKPSISILKKPPLNNIVKAEQGKPATVLKINPSNSLLLNSNSAVPALQIATPLAQNCDLNKRNMTVQNRPAQMKLKRLPKNVKIDGNEDFKPPKVSVTLGKDKQKILSKRDEYEDVIRSIETVEINDTVGTLRFIMKRIPLITEKARDSEYKQMHPYACCTEEEFINYHLGKQRAHEWYRAKTVRSLLRKKGFVDDKLWSIKEILYWARMHGYTPIQSSLALVASGKSSKKLPDSVGQVSISTCTESLQFNEWLENCKDCKDNCDDESDIEVDVVHIANQKIKTEIKSEPMDLPQDTITLEIPPPLRLPCAFVNETAREIGVKLQKEEIVPGVLDSTAERIIAQAMQSLVDDLMRRSLSKAWERNSNKSPDTIILEDVRGAILSREEFDVFTNEGLGSLQNNG